MFKLEINTHDQTVAHHFFGLLSEIYEPAANSISVFEHNTSWLVEGYFEQQKEAESAALWLCAASCYCVPSWSLSKVDDRNWVALSQAGLPPVYAGRYTIYGSHDKKKVGRGPKRILIDAGEAFGTAHHATTYGCLIAIDYVTRRKQFKKILDLGTGSGILALALRRAMPQAHILGTDFDGNSIDVAKANAAINGSLSITNGRLMFATSLALQDKSIRQAQPFNLIVANILASSLIQMARDIAPALQRGGNLVLSGILYSQARQVIAQYNSHGLRLLKHLQIDAWSTIIMVK